MFDIAQIRAVVEDVGLETAVLDRIHADDISDASLSRWWRQAEEALLAIDDIVSDFEGIPSGFDG